MAVVTNKMSDLEHFIGQTVFVRDPKMLNVETALDTFSVGYYRVTGEELCPFLELRGNSAIGFPSNGSTIDPLRVRLASDEEAKDFQAQYDVADAVGRKALKNALLTKDIYDCVSGIR
ncbi:MAG: hypothetical protein P0S94_03385 [Simkaniaceae bacterium]|nr:hypothetical protein [Simkaniaceae bacterium]